MAPAIGISKMARIKNEELTIPLLSEVTCPHCWEVFAPQDVLFISDHNNLLGDARLGEDAKLRFLPTRFNRRCQPLDPLGHVSHDMACPNCHLLLPKQMIENKCRFLSILGAPASGKSYFLGSMIWQTRKVLLRDFGYSFTDAHPQFNKVVISYEDALFLNPKRDQSLPVGELIPKTQFTGNLLFNEINQDGRPVRLPQPFLFEYRVPDPAGQTRTRLMCLYDNAGESFLAGSEDASAYETTKHLANSSALFFVFDPLQDPRFADALEAVEPGASRFGLPFPVQHRQEIILREASVRIRRFLSMRNDEKHKSPLVVVVGKYDVWWKLFPEAKKIDWLRNSRAKSGDSSNSQAIPGVNLSAINRLSANLRALLFRLCPDMVGTAEFFAEQVIFLPVSALGFSCKEFSELSGDPTLVRPRDIDPFQVELPLIWYLTRSRTKSTDSEEEQED